MSWSFAVRGAARAALLVVALLLLGFPARAELRLDITRGTAQPLPIAIPPFPGPGDAATVGRDIAQVVAADLERSGLFRPVDPRAFIQTVAAGESPRFADWRQINAQALVTGSVQPQGDGRLRVEFRLWDVFAEQQLAGFAFTTTRQNWRRIAHVIADQIYKRITGEDGYFDTRIVYIAESGPAQARVKRLAIMDQDGANNQYLTDGRSLVLTPRFSPSAQQITYLSYAGRTPRVYLYNIETGQQEPIGDFPGHDLRAALLARRHRARPQPHRGRRDKPVRARSAQPAAGAADQRQRDRYLAQLFAGRQPHRVQLGPRRLAAALRDERRRRRGATDQLRFGEIRHAGMVAARRPDRVHQDRRRIVLHRRDAAGRFRRAAA